MRKDHIAVIILLIVIFGGAALLFRSDRRTTHEKNIALAKEKFEQEEYLSGIPEKDRQGFYDAITSQKDWVLKDENVNYAETQNAFFPVTANYHALFENPHDSNDYFAHTQLFIYDIDHDTWLPLAVDGTHMKDDKILKADDDNLWSKYSDWGDYYHVKANP